MSNTINLGTILTQNGRTTANGIASGLDSATLIDGILEGRQVTVDKLKDNIETNNTKVSALGDLRLLLERFQSASNVLRNPPGVNNASSNLFQYTTSTLSSNTSVAASEYLSITSEPGATVNSYLVDNISLAEEHVLRKDNFTSRSTSVVGNISVVDDYSANVDYSSGSVLSATTPLQFTNDIRNVNGEAATIDIVFGDQNKFDASDEFIVGSTTITFGGSGGADLTDTGSVSGNVTAIANYLNTVATGDESDYTYVANGTTLTITRDIVGENATVGTDLAIAADFSKGTGNTTQQVTIGSKFKSNGPVSGKVNEDGFDGANAAAKASINLTFSDNVSAGDTITVGSSTLTFDTDIVIGVSLAETLENTVNALNDISSGDESKYSYTISGNSIVVTRDALGEIATVGNDIDISADFSNSGETLTIGSANASITPSVANAIATNGTDGVDVTSVTSANTTHTPNLNGSITIGGTSTLIAGSGTATSFSPNTVQFTATVNGITYTSRPIELAGGSIDADSNGSGDNGDGLNGYGNRIPAGTVITFVNDTQTDTSTGKADATFQLVVGDEATINNQTDVDNFVSDINDFISNNSVSITENTDILPFRAGTFNLQGTDITLEEGDTLNTIRSKINAVSSLTGVSADIIKIAEDNYSLIIKSSDTGAENAITSFDINAFSSPNSGAFRIGGGNVEFTQVQAASDASFDLDGQTITRSSNSINDVVDKVTFNLLAETAVSAPTTNITVNIKNDIETIKSGIVDFLNAYNELKTYIAIQTERDESNQLVETAVLGDDDGVLNDVFRPIQEEIAGIVAGLSGREFQSLFEIGVDTIDFPGDGEIPATEDIFTLDETALDAALSKDFESVRDLFTYTFSSNSPNLGVFSRSNAASINNFQLDIDTSRDSGDEVRVKDSTGNFLYNATYDAKNNTITGIAGTTLEGTKFIYTGDGSEIITVGVTQGVSDYIYNFLDDFLDEDNGTLALTVDNLTNKNDRAQDNIDREESRIETERERLTAKFAQLESFIADINNTLSFIESQFDAFSNNN